MSIYLIFYHLLTFLTNKLYISSAIYQNYIFRETNYYFIKKEKCESIISFFDVKIHFYLRPYNLVTYQAFLAMQQDYGFNGYTILKHILTKQEGQHIILLITYNTLLTLELYNSI